MNQAKQNMPLKQPRSQGLFPLLVGGAGGGAGKGPGIGRSHDLKTPKNLGCTEFIY